jgi:hypothetical protein
MVKVKNAVHPTVPPVHRDQGRVKVGGEKDLGCCCAGKDPLNYVGLDADEDDDKGCQQGGGRRGGGAEW